MRKYIDLIEATLYRGDSTEIDAYDTSKTYDNALFGRGIYLTDKKEVASDYTVNKGAIDQIVSNPRVEYHSQRDAIVGVITDILNKELDWPEQADRLMRKPVRSSRRTIKPICLPATARRCARPRRSTRSAQSIIA